MPTLVPLNNQFSSLADDAYLTIKQKIFSFEMLPGDLISEGNLVRLMQVSRTPLRQALQRLQYEGFLNAIPKIGWQIAPLDFNKLDELYDFRILIEGHAIKILCDKASSHDPLNELVKIWLCKASDRIQDGEQVGLLDENFHHQLVRIAGNHEMLRMHQEISERIRIVRRLDFTKSNRIQETYDEHAKILNAILDRRGAEAKRLLTSHIDQSKIEVRKITLAAMHEVKEKVKLKVKS
ncbi:MAG: GntR family transcriptional regulator [Burkholderiaceae bacterium]|jgi:DNA-binding GntR family transcriptional regulator|nr:GntR family transcriptional regulator [Burkholderiaceae bacterium]NCA09815.1 GntR family transcriptional regulator [Burkholderiaceae bacterium]NCU94094.1 GntR family transcriptional regulator [Burkholderiaceae bacterium]